MGPGVLKPAQSRAHGHELGTQAPRLGFGCLKLSSGSRTNPSARPCLDCDPSPGGANP